jgi:hypothetical protein
MNHCTPTLSLREPLSIEGLYGIEELYGNTSKPLAIRYSESAIDGKCSNIVEDADDSSTEYESCIEASDGDETGHKCMAEKSSLRPVSQKTLISCVHESLPALESAMKLSKLKSEERILRLSMSLWKTAVEEEKEVEQTFRYQGAGKLELRKPMLLSRFTSHDRVSWAAFRNNTLHRKKENDFTNDFTLKRRDVEFLSD